MELGPQEDQLFLATNRAGQNQRRQAVIVIGIAIVACLIAAPFARVPFPPAWAFLSVHESALFVITLITAVLLFGQFEIVRSRALLILAAGYLYAAVMAVPHLLAFPGIFGTHGPFGTTRKSQPGYLSSGGLATKSRSLPTRCCVIGNRHSVPGGPAGRSRLPLRAC